MLAASAAMAVGGPLHCRWNSIWCALGGGWTWSLKKVLLSFVFADPDLFIPGWGAPLVPCASIALSRWPIIAASLCLIALADFVPVLLYPAGPFHFLALVAQHPVRGKHSLSGPSIDRRQYLGLLVSGTQERRGHAPVSSGGGIGSLRARAWGNVMGHGEPQILTPTY